MNGDRPPPPAPLATWAIRRLLPDREAAAVLQDLAELHRAWSESLGPNEADRRYRRQLRQYPARLLLERLMQTVRWPAPDRAEEDLGPLEAGLWRVERGKAPVRLDPTSSTLRAR